MWKAPVLLALLMLSPGSDGLFRSIYGKAHVFKPPKGNVGEPLFLTPYIEAGKFAEGRRLSLVAPFPGWNLMSYSGYITVNKTYNSNLFFWFFPAKIDPWNAPVVLWLQGGPGGSSMFGLFVEHGPYVVRRNMTVLARDFPWTTTFSMLYIDNPVGTGFSFTDHPQGYAVDEDDVARDLYSALIQFFLLFSDYKENDFYATGESYAGKYVPALAHYIHALNPAVTLKINLKGIALGDAYFDPDVSLRWQPRLAGSTSVIGGYAPFLFHIGLLDEKQRKYFQKQCDVCVKYIQEEKWSQAFELLDKLLDGGLTREPSYFQNVTGCPNYYNLLQCTEPEDQSYYGKFLSLPQVRQAIHVGNRTFSDGSKVEKYLREDTVKSVKPWLTEIMNNYKVIVRGGGHILPYDQPLRSFDMINRFVFERGWDPY
ncbi:probable serine carboxypeptidase CPVL isoform X4 [Sus scrofa]|uniref:probable serine carboxypeptidase CPVL isoform X4 n=1 Tax=Sus scrofa TaxID=9823 RepID=UPI000A2B8B15|nr:probable serine carboxypeptidase CPVL isoform X4 [Sus scrofa]